MHGLSAIVILVTLWVLTRPYEGIVRNAELYLVQALHRLDPARFAGDLFFAFGSQDRYSAVSLLYAPLVEALGPAKAHLAAVLFGQALWLGALWLLVGVLCGRGRLRLAAAMAVVAMVPVYKFAGLGYAESVATPRIFVEALSLAAVACALRGRAGLALVALGIAFPLNPVMALPTVGLVALVWLPFRWVMGLAFAGTGALLALALAGVDPFARALVAMDADWLAVVSARTQSGFSTGRILPTLVLWALPAVALTIVALRGSGGARRLARAVLLLCPALWGTGALFGDVFTNLLVLNLQLWRGMWLWMVVGNCLVPLAFLALPNGGRARALLLAAVAVNVVEARVGLAAFPVGSACLSLSVLSVWGGEGASKAWWRKLAGGAGFALAAVAALLFLAEIAALALQPGVGDRLELFSRIALVLASGGLGLAVVSGRVSAGWGITVLGCGLLSVSLLLADQRDDRMRFLTGDVPVDPAFAAALAGQTVYWEDGLGFLWLRLRQPSYYSCNQAAGVMFFRDTAMEHARRGEVLRHLNTVDFGMIDDRLCPQRADPAFEGPTSPTQLQDVCRALPELDVLVLRSDLASVPHLRWQPGFDVPQSGIPTPSPDHDPGYVKGQPRGTFNLYRCADLR